MTLSINQLKDEAKEDCFIDKNKLDKYSLDLAKITSKWNSFLLDEKKYYETEYIKYAVLRKKKFEYYQYDYQYVVEKRGKEMEVYLDADIELQRQKQTVTISKEKINFIENTIKTLNTSSFNVRNAIEFIKFQSGAY